MAFFPHRKGGLFGSALQGFSKATFCSMKKMILSKHSDLHRFDVFTLRHLSFPRWQMSKWKVVTGRKKEKSGVETTLDQIRQTISQLDVFLIQNLSVKRK